MFIPSRSAVLKALAHQPLYTRFSPDGERKAFVFMYVENQRQGYLLRNDTKNSLLLDPGMIARLRTLSIFVDHTTGDVFVPNIGDNIGDVASAASCLRNMSTTEARAVYMFSSGTKAHMTIFGTRMHHPYQPGMIG